MNLNDCNKISSRHSSQIKNKVQDFLAFLLAGILFSDNQTN